MNDFDPGAIRAKLKAQRTAAPDAVNRGLRLGAEHLLGTARRLVPTEEGILEGSGKVSVDEATFTAAVSFDTPYAVRQHEDLTFKHDPGRQAKYLEQPMHTEAATIARLVAGPVKKGMST